MNPASPLPLIVAASVWLAVAAGQTLAAEPPPVVTRETFVEVLVGDTPRVHGALTALEGAWQDAFVPMVLETVYLSRDPMRSLALLELLKARTGQDHGFDLRAWQTWMWNRPIPRIPLYSDFKAHLYKLIDPAFERYFADQPAATIRLDEIVWGGVRQDGIPPLRDPAMVSATAADYLADSDAVFGVAVNGDVRAYPRRILAWHEMFTDTIGGVPVAGVYCTLCGTVILYHTRVGGTTHEIGTSGFLYRSNKLMYDKATHSLWSTFRGVPVVGALVGQGIELTRGSVVTTTWGAWRTRHPDTRVLSLETGHRRDYAEGAAYRDYFATDELMFAVPGTDSRLKNKAEVLAVLHPGAPGDALAISASFLSRHPVYHDALGHQRLVVLTDTSGANRVYASDSVRFRHFDGDRQATTADGTVWRVSEAALTASDGRRLTRMPAQRAFWFGWHAAFPHTRLVTDESERSGSGGG